MKNKNSNNVEIFPSELVPRATNNKHPKTAADRNHWDIFFGDPTFFEKGKKAVWWAIGIALASLTVAGFLIFWTEVIEHQSFPDTSPPTGWLSGLRTLGNIFLGFGVSITGGAATALLINWGNIAKINSIRNLADDSLLRQFFSILGKYAGRYEAEKEIRMKLLRPSSEEDVSLPPDFLMMEVELSFYTMLENSAIPLAVIFNRYDAKTSKDKPSLDRDGSGQLDKISNLIWYYENDETELQKVTSVDLEGLYEVDYVAINHSEVGVECIREDGSTRWNVTSAEQLDQGKPVHVYIKLRYPVELNGYNYFVPLIPVHIFKLEYDFKAVSKFVSVYSENLLNARSVSLDDKVNGVVLRRKRSGDQGNDQNREDGVIRLGYNDWVLPNSSVMFVRFKKEPSEATPEKKSVAKKNEPRTSKSGSSRKK